MKIKIKLNQMEELTDLHNDYPYAYHHVDLAVTLVPWHWHEALELNYVISGSVNVTTTNQSQVFSANEAFFINSNVLAAMNCVGSCIMDSHLFHPAFLGGHFKSIFETKYLNPIIQNRHIEIIPIRGETPEQRQLLQKLRQLAQLQAAEDTEFQTRNTLSEIWLLLLKQQAQFQTKLSDSYLREQDRIQSMMAWIHENYAEKITLEQISAAASISTRECLRCFRSSIQQTPMEYLMGYRVDAARKLLSSTDLPVTEIAIRTGFNSGAYFTKIFKRITGKTPLAFRSESINTQ